MAIQSKVSSTLRRAKFLAWSWVFVVLSLGVWLGLTWTPERVQTDILSVFPTQSKPGLSAKDERALAESLSREMLWLVEGSREDVERLYQGLVGTGAFTQWRGPMSEAQQEAWAREAMKGRLAMADKKELLKQWEAKTPEQDSPLPGIEKTLALVYSPLGPNAKEVMKDPFLLLRNSRLLEANASAFTLEDGWFRVKTQDQHAYWVLSGTLETSVAKGRAGVTLVKTIEALEAEVRSQAQNSSRTVTLWHQGALWHSAHAAQLAQYDMTRLGILSAVSLALLLLVVYRSLLPLLLTLGSIVSGAIVGVAVTLGMFGTIHLLTLVMCLSLVGICADYTTYYVTMRRYADPQTSSWDILRTLRPTLWHAMISTALGYGMLGFAPMQGLQQLALFAIAGVGAAWLTVVSVFPFFVNRIRAVPLGRPWLSTSLQGLKRYPRLRWSVLGLWTLIAIGGLSLTNYSDDLRKLQAPEAELVRQEAHISEVLNQRFNQTGFIVTAPSAEVLLARMEALRETLGDLRRAGHVRRSVENFPLSLATQARLRERLSAVWPSLQAAYRDLGVNLDSPQLPEPVSFEAWLEGPVGHEYRNLVHVPEKHEDSHRRWAESWGTSESFRALIPVELTDETHADVVRESAQTLEGVYWQNRRQDLEKVLGQTKTLLFGLLGAVFGVLSLSLVVGFGCKRALKASLALGLSLTTATASTLLIAQPVNVFTLFALIVVLGVGIDYQLFFLKFQHYPEMTLRAMGLALLSTLLSLGILAFASTAAVVNFGWVLSVGVLSAFVLAPLVQGETNG